MKEMVEEIRIAFEKRLMDNDWMSIETKTKAVEKLNKISIKIGYPDVWRDYTNLSITNKSYLQNIISCNQYSTQRQLNQVGKPVNREDWGMTPQEVNAYYNPLQNEIVFPAAILQAPFFNKSFDAAVNYGAIGSVIAHEFTHAFDDEGSQYDANGNLVNWWTNDDRQKFKAKQQLIINQYNKYTVYDSLNANGALSVGENIADLGGITIAYDAYKAYEKKHLNEIKSIDGFTPDQRFFIAWTQLWRQNKTIEALKIQINTSTTSPYILRGFAPLTNFKPFLDSFKISNNDQMALPIEKRFVIW
jgi:putative endopeptidase